MLDDFQHQSGQVIDAYWCHKEASAVALTRREVMKRGRFGRKRKIEYRLHRVSDWVTDSNHEIADLLHDSDILGLKAAASLEGVPRAVVMQWLLLVDSHLLGFLERYRHEPVPSRGRRALRRQRARRAAPHRGLLLPRRREAGAHALHGRHGHLRRRARRRRGGRDRARARVLHSFSVDSTAVQEFYAAAAAGGSARSSAC